MIVDQNALVYFSKTYPELREKFLANAKKVTEDLQSYKNEALGPNGEVLYADVARVGSRTAERTIVLVSGTHGVEGYSGSGCFSAWLDSKTSIPGNTAVILINALNPYGVAWQRRQNEHNVDINRNFIDHNKKPENPSYEKLHHALVPAELSDATLARAKQEITDFRKRFGDDLYWRAFGGQYTHEDGVFYGGNQPEWSNDLLCRLMLEHCSNAEAIGFIDFHSGLGPFGYGTLISSSRQGTAAFNRAQRWFGQSVISLASVDSDDGKEADSESVDGHTMDCVEALLPNKEVTCTTLEFGTFPFDDCIELMGKEASLFRTGDSKSAQAKEIRRQWMNVFYPDSPDWIEMIWRRSMQVIRQAIEGVSR